MVKIAELISDIPSFIFIITGVVGFLFYNSLSKQQKKYDKWLAVVNTFNIKEELLSSGINNANKKVKKDLTIAWLTLFSFIILLIIYIFITNIVYITVFTLILAINFVIYTKYFNKVAYQNILYNTPKSINEENFYIALVNALKWNSFKKITNEESLKTVRNLDYKFILISSNLIDFSKKTDPNYEKAVGSLIVQCAENVLMVRKYLDKSFMLGAEKSLDIHKIFLNYEKEIIDFENKTSNFKTESENVYQEVQNILELLNNCKTAIENALRDYDIDNLDVKNFIELKPK